MSTSKQMKYIDSAGKETIVDIAVNAANVENNTFTQAAARSNIASGETLPGIFGKLSKWFVDLKAVAWSGKYTDLTDRPAIGPAAAYGVVNNCGTTAANYVLDARQGQVLQANINQVNSKLNKYQYLTTYTSSMGGIIDLMNTMESCTYVTFFLLSGLPAEYPSAKLGTTVYAIMEIYKYGAATFINITNTQSTCIPNHISGYHQPNIGFIWGEVY